MKLNKIIDKLDIKLVNNVDLEEIEIEYGYVGDLLSDVLANAKENSAWFTIQKHQNILAVADAKNISAIIVVNGVTPDEILLKKADAKNIPILTTKNSSFIEAGKLYSIL
ncbi:MAG TPA: DRTGG domain-containing protein [Candidatus Mcinerneyibacterium sp.]|nr:DRTGG domain-containing protein [Candidatus Mcinerneyibacterium sp.]